MPPLALARDLLQRHFGHPDFRPAQRPVVQDVLLGRDVLAVLATGGGKSVCFQVPALALGGLTVVVSPLIALMADQVAACRRRGIAAATLSSATPAAERAEIERSIRSGELRLLYASPERLATLAAALGEWGARVALLAVDEAHCISEWGHDFRPAYRRLRAVRSRLGDPPVVALTGSATPEVRRDIAESLGLGAGGRRVATHVATFDRGNLWFGVETVRTEGDRLRRVLAHVPRDGSVSIVYAPTRNVVDGLALALVRAGRDAMAYHAGLDADERRARLERFLSGDARVVVATCAFGMGIDKPDVRRVVHWAAPPTPESYYQEAGRAGRDGAPSRAVLLWRPGDAALAERQLDVTFPPRARLERLWADPELLARAPAGERDSALRLREELRPDAGPVDWGRISRRRRAALARLAAMRRYAERGACRRAALLEWFGERLDRCAGCDRCDGTTAAAPRWWSGLVARG